MSDVSSIGPGSIGPLSRAAVATVYQNGRAAAHVNGQAKDRVELSEHARLLSRLRQLDGIRHEHVQAIREEIMAGTYEAPEKLDAAIDRLWEDLQ